MPSNIAIFASGTGSNAKKIIEYFKNDPDINIALLVSNNPKAPALDMASSHGVETLLLKKHDHKNPTSLIAFLKREKIDLIVLAGYLRLIHHRIVEEFPMRILNIHPALLPKYGGKGMYGMNVHKSVHGASEKSSGITIHYVNELYDDGEYIMQVKCALDEDDTPEIISKKVRELEHKYYPMAIEKIIQDLNKQSSNQ